MKKVNYAFYLTRRHEAKANEEGRRQRGKKPKKAISARGSSHTGSRQDYIAGSSAKGSYCFCVQRSCHMTPLCEFSVPFYKMHFFINWITFGNRDMYARSYIKEKNTCLINIKKLKKAIIYIILIVSHNFKNNYYDLLIY